MDMQVKGMRMVSRLLIVCSFALAFSAGARSASAEGVLRKGDRVVLLGGTVVEQAQRYGYFEAMLQMRTESLDVSVRNLGWSGDDASGMARKVFGDPAQGFARLLRDLETASPTVVVVAFGTAEALDGLPAARQFEPRLIRLLDEIENRHARSVIALPYRMPGAKRADYPESLAMVREILTKTAKQRNLPVIDWGADLRDGDLPDGLHPEHLGHWKLGKKLAEGLCGTEVADSTPSVQFTANANDQGGAVRQTMRLTTPPVPGTESTHVQLTAKGLASGKYRVRAGDWSQTFSAAELASGVAVTVPQLRTAYAQLIDEVVEKDTLFFHRHRPQNETYLFLFRKHEQGNNAVEIPQFDPLLEQADSRIRKLARTEVPVEIKIERE